MESSSNIYFNEDELCEIMLVQDLETLTAFCQTNKLINKISNTNRFWIAKLENNYKYLYNNYKYLYNNYLLTLKSAYSKDIHNYMSKHSKDFFRIATNFNNCSDNMNFIYDTISFLYYITTSDVKYDLFIKMLLLIYPDGNFNNKLDKLLPKKENIDEHLDRIIITALLPRDFTFHEKGIIIIDGIYCSGILNKTCILALIKFLETNYDNVVVNNFLINVNRLSEIFLDEMHSGIKSTAVDFLISL